MVNARQSAVLRSLKKPVLLFCLVGVPLATGGASALSGCGGGGGTGGGGGGSGSTGDACFDYTTFKADSTVTFKDKVLPLMQRSCGISTSCHQSESPSNAAQHYFGPAMGMTATQTQIDDIFKQSVGVASVSEPAMKVIDPSHPETSFIMYKLDNELTCTKLNCAANGTCGTLMPQGSSMPLPQSERDIIRSWIANGAKND